MSFNSFKNSKDDNEKSSEIEETLQKIVNDLTSSMEFLQYDIEVFNEFENLFRNSGTLEEIIKAISMMVNELFKKLEKKDQTKLSPNKE